MPTRYIQPASQITKLVRDWHTVFGPSFETLVALGYLRGASPHRYSLDIHNLGSGDGKVSFFGSDTVTPGMQPWPTYNAKSFYIVSSSASDTGTAVVYGVNASDLSMAIIEVALTGTTPALISSALCHVNAVLYKGGNDANVGELFVSEKATAGLPAIAADNVQVIVGDGWGYAPNPTMMAADAEVMIFPEINISADKNDGCEIEIYCGLSDGVQFNRQKVAEWYLYSTAFQNEFIIPLTIANGEWIRLTIERTAGTGDVQAACDLRHYGINYFDAGESSSSMLFND